MDINTSVKKVRGYQKGMEKITSASLKANETTAAKWNVQQMEIGLRSDGKSQPNYSDGSVEYYGKEPGPVKLKDTGAFHESVLRKTKAKKDVLEFTGDYIKDNAGGRTDLEKVWGPIFGLTKSNLEKMTDLLFEDLVKGLRDYWK